MESKKTEQKSASELRKRAEVKLKSETTASKTISDKETRQLIHELQVHQIELEMQNDELRKAQAEIEESRAKYSDLYDFAPVGYFTFDRKGLILEANLTAAKELGIERGLLVNKPFRAYIVTEDREVFDSHLQKVFKSNDRQTCEIRLKRKDGIGIYAQLESIAANDLKGNPLCRSSVIDVTEHKKLEENVLITRKLESVGILAGGIAHDFNNLLQAIMGNIYLAKMLLPTASPEKISSLLGRAEETLETAKELSFRLLTFSKGSEPVKRSSIVESIIRKSMADSLSVPGIACDVAIPHSLYPIEIDEGQMLQVFNNILINAKEAMPDGGSIRITARNVTISEGNPMHLKEGDYVQISIKDNGISIPEDSLPKIFDPYFSTKETGTRKGSGLGLAICFSIVGKHEGHISVESGQGMGTTFHVFLPASVKVPHIQETAPASQDVSTPRLLFMDDDADIRIVIEEIMDYLGHKAEYARNGEEAVEIFRRAKESGTAFDVVILDLTVKEGMGGDKAIKKILEIDHDAKVIISSGYFDDPIIKDYKQYGFANAIIKPYKMEQLRDILNKHTAR